MRGWVGNTDYDWYEFLRSHPELPEVNFWQPSGSRAFHVIDPGAPFFFRLKSPHNAIGGFGILSRAEILPAWLAWDTFGIANGAATRDEMVHRIERYRKGPVDPGAQYLIGCLMILDPVFFEPSHWVREPEKWPGSTVQGKSYDLREGDGLRLWEECRLMSRGINVLKETRNDVRQRYGDAIEIKPRLGQGSFRIAVMDAYSRACAVTTEHSLPVLESAHIKGYADGGEHEVSNGILLRSDIHRLFDKGYVTVTNDYHFIVSGRLKQDFANGKSYYGLHGKRLHLPDDPKHHPSAEMLIWHNENCYKE